MKAAILTLHTVANYGTQLQALASQEKLKQYFEEVEFIDYRRPDTYGAKLIETFSKGNVIKALAVLPTIIYWKYIFGGFQKKYLNIGKTKYLTQESFRHFVEDADVYFVGSDQVWNSGWNKGIIPAMFLDFVSDAKPKFAYSSSFGKSVLEEKEVTETKKYVERFRRISVREESGLEILKTQCGYENGVRIIDPTLAMPPEFWRSVAKKKRKIKEKYILIYNLNRSKEFDEYASKLSDKTGLPLYRFCTRFDQIFRNGKSLVIPDILEFVSLIDGAEMVLTDSFHATAFSMNLNTEPICVYPNDYSGRISEFLKLVDSEQRRAVSFEDLDVIDRHTDFDKVNRILKEEREKADSFLADVLEEIKA